MSNWGEVGSNSGVIGDTRSLERGVLEDIAGWSGKLNIGIVKIVLIEQVEVTAVGWEVPELVTEVILTSQSVGGVRRVGRGLHIGDWRVVDMQMVSWVYIFRGCVVLGEVDLVIVIQDRVIISVHLGVLVVRGMHAVSVAAWGTDIVGYGSRETVITGLVSVLAIVL